MDTWAAGRQGLIYLCLGALLLLNMCAGQDNPATSNSTQSQTDTVMRNSSSGETGATTAAGVATNTSDTGIVDAQGSLGSTVVVPTISSESETRPSENSRTDPTDSTPISMNTPAFEVTNREGKQDRDGILNTTSSTDKVAATESSPNITNTTDSTLAVAMGTRTPDVSSLDGNTSIKDSTSSSGYVKTEPMTIDALEMTTPTIANRTQTVPVSSPGGGVGPTVTSGTNLTDGTPIPSIPDTSTLSTLSENRTTEFYQSTVSTSSPTTEKGTTTTSNPCDIDPCQNNSTCVPAVDGYTCMCVPGTTGVNCSQDIDECLSRPCANGGICEDRLNSFLCRCTEGYAGELCQTDIDECDAAPCQNGATCTNLIASFACTCPPGFTGLTCQTNIDECASRPCLNNGTCIDGANSYTCDCSQFWTGATCEQDVDECSLTVGQPCHPRASCNNTIGGYDCTCQRGFSGDGHQCQFINLCDDAPCYGGTCLPMLLNYTCKCEAGWVGNNCSEDVDECKGPLKSTCNEAYGECMNTPGSFYCKCQEGSHGDGSVCFRDSLYPLGADKTRHQGDIDTGAIYVIPGGFPYFGERYYKIFVSMDGYVTLNQDVLPPNPPGGARPVFPPRTPIIAPWWMDLDTTYGPGALYIDKYEAGDNTSLLSTLSSEIRRYEDRDDLDISFALVITWQEVEPYPTYQTQTGKENATFQLVMATTGEESFAMFNYNPDGPWFNMAATERRFLIGYSFGNGSSTSIDLTSRTPGYQTNIDHKGRYFFTLGDKLDLVEKECISWYKRQRTPLKLNTLPCPCSMGQALLDTRFIVLHREPQTCISSLIYEDGARQICCYTSEGALMKGYPEGGYPVSNDTEAGRNYCCKMNELCHLFYEVRPSDDCMAYTIPKWGLLWGIGHIYTLHGEKLTFNDRGEFVLVNHSSFLLQGRMDRIPSLANGIMATALVAVAAKTPMSSKIEVYLAPSSTGITFVIDGEAGRALDTLPQGLPASYNGFYLIRHQNDSLLVQFTSGDGFIVNAVEDVLRLRVMVTSSTSETTGIFTGTLGSTQEQLSQYAAIEAGRSLFSESLGGLDQRYRDPDYLPSDLTAAINEVKRRVAGNDTDVAEPCDGIEPCYYDFVATGGDINRGVSAITEEVKMMEGKRKLANFPPWFDDNLPAVLNVSQDRPFPLQLRAIDPDDRNVKITYTYETNLEEDFAFSSSGTWRWVPKAANSSIYIKFIATDEQGASSIYWPEINFCECETANTRSCEFDNRDILGTPSNRERFYKAPCSCLPGYDGRLCSETVDVCDPNPCYNSTAECVPTRGTLLNSVKCSPCPNRLKGDGLKCYDENECIRGTSKCSQTCLNNIGSYTCQCWDGYLLLSDGATCVDVDECTEDKHDCSQPGMYCQNIPGSYSCSCKAKFFMDNGTCKPAPRRFGGDLTFQLVKLAPDVIVPWSDDLADPESDAFKTVASQINSLLQDLYKSSDGFITSQVTSFRRGSITASYNLYYDSATTVDGDTLNDTMKTFLASQQCWDDGPACTVGPMVGVDITRSFAGAKNLCLMEADNDCDDISTVCNSHGDGTFSCKCKEGYQSWLDVNNICQDINECEGYNTCDQENSKCINTPGSHRCECKEGFRRFNGLCVPACRPNPCLHDGECIPALFKEEQYTCKCRGYWYGTNCGIVNKEARKLEQILIGIGVGLGVICIILVIVIIVTCIRCRRRKVHDSLQEVSDKKVNERIRNAKQTYSTAAEVGLDSWDNSSHVVTPASHHLRTTQLEMVENGSKQNLLTGGKPQAPGPQVAASGEAAEVSFDTLQRLMGHAQPYSGISSFSNQAYEADCDDDHSGSYVDDFDSDSHHSGSYSHTSGLKPLDPAEQAARPFAAGSDAGWSLTVKDRDFSPTAQQNQYGMHSKAVYRACFWDPRDKVAFNIDYVLPYKPHPPFCAPELSSILPSTGKYDVPCNDPVLGIEHKIDIESQAHFEDALFLKLSKAVHRILQAVLTIFCSTFSNNYSPRHADSPGNYGNGEGVPPGGATGVENPSYSQAAQDNGDKQLDSQYF